MNDIITFIKAIKNPQEFVLQSLSTNTNPMIKNLVEMAKNGDKQGIENFARNFFKENGQDYDQIMSMFK